MLKSRKIVTVILLSLAVVLLAGGLFCVLLLEPAVPFGPRLDEARLAHIERTVTVLDNDGNPLVDQIYDNNKRYIPLTDIPEHTRNAFIAIEDKRFYKHKGLDYRQIVGAAIYNINS